MIPSSSICFKSSSALGQSSSSSLLLGPEAWVPSKEDEADDDSFAECLFFEDFASAVMAV